MTAQFKRGSISFKDLYWDGFYNWFYTRLNAGAVYLGPAYIVEEPGSWFVSPSVDGGIVLIRGKDNVLRAFMNVCRHREKMLFVPESNWSSGYSGTLNGDRIICSAHSWSYNGAGEHLNSPAFGVKCDLSQDLYPANVATIGGSLWMYRKEKDLTPVREMLNLLLARKYGVENLIPTGYELRHIWVDYAPYHPATGMEVYGDVTHVGGGTTHPETLKRTVIGKKLEIDLRAPSGASSLQMVPWNANPDTRSKMEEHWKLYHFHVEGYSKEHLGDPTRGKVLWFAHYPDGTTIEHFPYMVVVSRFAPVKGSGQTRNVVEFYFPERWGTQDAAVRAYKALAAEDAQLCVDMDRGRKALLDFGHGSKVSGWVHPHEEGVVGHYFDWLREEWKEK